MLGDVEGAWNTINFCLGVVCSVWESRVLGFSTCLICSLWLISFHPLNHQVAMEGRLWLSTVLMWQSAQQNDQPEL